MDSDLNESIAALKEALSKLGLPATFAQADAARLAALQSRFGIPRRYSDFLAACDPQDIETATPSERILLLSSASLEEEQRGFCIDEKGEPLKTAGKGGWRPSWFIIGHSALLGDPYFLDVSNIDAEGDCPVYSAMSGTDSWQPKLCASSFAMFIRILAITMDVAHDFDLDDYDPDNERVFREAIRSRIREVDPAALKARHWT